MTISLCMIVKNEEDVIERCLSSAKDVIDEIIIVDTGSTDSTKSIAQKYTDKVYDFKWCDDFSKARNFSFSKATMDYCMWLDADDIIDKEQIEKIKELKKNNSDADVYMVKYATGFDENDNVTFLYYRERIVRRCELAVWNGRVHEAIAPFGKIEYTDIVIKHRKNCDVYSDRNLKIYEDMERKGERFSPREHYYYGRELFYHKEYERAINQFEKLTVNKDGWIENVVDSFKMIAFCYKNLGDRRKCIESLFEGNSVDTPRADICCHIGEYFLENDRLEQAVFWFKNALNCQRNDSACGFVEVDFFDYIPYLQLCVCLDRMGRTKEAYYYNKKAGEIKGNSDAVNFNNRYFQSKLKEG